MTFGSYDLCKLEKLLYLKNEPQYRRNSAQNETKKNNIMKYYLISQTGESCAKLYVCKEPMASVKRFMKKKKAKVDIPCPKAITIYNRYMGGVDLLGFYRIKVRSKKWYHRIFFHMIDLVCVNSWLLWRRRMEQIGDKTYLSLLDFKLNLADILMREDVSVFTPTTRHKGRPPIQVEKTKKRRRHELLPIEVAEDGFNHWPTWKGDRQICKLVGCDQKSQMICSKCKCYLCLNKKSTCFT